MPNTSNTGGGGNSTRNYRVTSGTRSTRPAPTVLHHTILIEQIGELFLVSEQPDIVRSSAVHRVGNGQGKKKRKKIIFRARNIVT